MNTVKKGKQFAEQEKKIKELNEALLKTHENWIKRENRRDETQSQKVAELRKENIQKCIRNGANGLRSL